jgi:hypothetical protein
VDWPGDNDPFFLYNTFDNGNRRGYYHVSGVPQAYVDGTVDPGGSSGYWPAIQNRYAVDAPLDIQLGGAYNPDTREGNLDVHILATDDIAFEGLFLKIALIESEINYPAPNGAAWHHQTMRKMLPTGLGTRIYIEEEGEVVDHTEPISCPEPLVEENCDIVVFVQAYGTRDILQAAIIRLTDIPTSVDEENSLPDAFSLAQNYPNPFNARTSINYTIDAKCLVELTVYDILGRKINTLVSDTKLPGQYCVVWDGVASDGSIVSSGVYFYRLVAGDNIVSKQMMLLK